MSRICETGALPLHHLDCGGNRNDCDRGDRFLGPLRARLDFGNSASAWWLCFIGVRPRALWRTREDLKGHGVALLSFSLLLFGLHHMGQPMWTLDQISWLRVAFADLLQIPIGLGMAVVVIETARRRTEDLNDKLRRLTLITAASAQSQKVDDVLQEALQNLVSNLNATHGIVRMVGTGADSHVLRTCACVGFSDEVP